MTQKSPQAIHSKFGIYVNPKLHQVVRINSPYWIPEPPDWVFLTPEVNATLVSIRETAKAKKLVADAEKLQWTSIPLRD